MEIWKDIENFEGCYQVSNTGFVKSVRGNNILKPGPTGASNKYNAVNLYVCGTLNRRSVHRLVAEAFVPNTENKPEVNHINGIPSDNRVENLEWCTRSENIQHSINITKTFPTGERHTNAKLSKESVLLIREYYKNKVMSGYKMAKEFGVSQGMINRICTNNKWKHI